MVSKIKIWEVIVYIKGYVRCWIIGLICDDDVEVRMVLYGLYLGFKVYLGNDDYGIVNV